MARLRASFEAAALNGNVRKMVRIAIESMVPMLKSAMYPRPVKVESIVGRRTTITAALPASPWTMPMANDLTRKTGLPKIKKLLWLLLLGLCWD